MRKPVSIILAAGYSSRMGDFKPLLKIGETTAIEYLIDTMAGCGIESVVAVTGYKREEVIHALKRSGKDHCGMSIYEVYNSKFEEGMFSSIKAGLKYCEDKGILSDLNVNGVLIVPVDCPAVSESTIKCMIDRANTDEDKCPCFMVPAFKGKKGHPLYISKKIIPEIIAHNGLGGLKAIMDRHSDLIKIPVEDEGAVMDMDTPEDYREITEFLNNGSRRVPLNQLAYGKRFILVRHGETVQHREKMFIGQYDVPLNAVGKKQIEEAAFWIKKLYPKTNKLYTSDLSRAVESAEILANMLDHRNTGVEIKKYRELREISLGEWDGKSIREIREKYPEQYEKRGKDIFSFKFGNEQENFFDMQYRVIRVLEKILTGCDDKDIIIVSHSGVIRAIENNLKGNQIDAEWDNIEKGGFRVIEV